MSKKHCVQFLSVRRVGTCRQVSKSSKGDGGKSARMGVVECFPQRWSHECIPLSCDHPTICDGPSWILWGCDYSRRHTHDSKSKLKNLQSFHSWGPATLLWGSPEATGRGHIPTTVPAEVPDNSQHQLPAEQASSASLQVIPTTHLEWTPSGAEICPTKPCSNCRSVCKTSAILGLSHYIWGGLLDNNKWPKQ